MKIEEIEKFDSKNCFKEKLGIRFPKSSKLYDYDFQVEYCSNFIEKVEIKYICKDNKFKHLLQTFLNKLGIKYYYANKIIKYLLIVKYNDNFVLPEDSFYFSMIQFLDKDDEDYLYQFEINGGDSLKIDTENKVFQIEFYKETSVNLKIVK